MIDYVIYDGDGRILQAGSTVESMFDLQADPAAGRHVLAGVGHPCLHWVVDGEIIERPELPASVSVTTVRADGSESVLVDGVPAGAAVLVVGPLKRRGEADGSVLSFTFAQPGNYHIVCALFPYKDWEVNIDAI